MNVDPNEPVTPDFLVTLGLMQPCSVEDVKQAYRIKVKSAHPDAGGSAAQFQKIQEAFERAMEYARFRAGRMAWLSNHVEQYAAQQALVGEIERQGGRAELEQIDWLKNSFGADFAQLVERIVGLNLADPQVGDDMIAWLLSERNLLESLHRLNLAGSRVSDRGAALLANFQSLRRLDLRQTPAGSRAVQLIEVLPKLEWIGLPRGTLGPLGRLRLRWRHRDLHVASDDEPF